MMIFKKPYYNYNKDLGDYFRSRSWKRANNYNVRVYQPFLVR